MRGGEVWQEGNGRDSMAEVESTGSGDSVVSFTSCLSEESQEYLSAEEKACISFLDRTIQSLDTEDHSGPPLHKPRPPEASRLQQEHSLSSDMLVQNEILHHMVPAPFVLAKPPAPTARAPPSCTEVCPDPPRPPEVGVAVMSRATPTARAPPSCTEVCPDPPRPPEVGVAVMSRAAPPRGPLSYEALVRLRKGVSSARQAPPPVAPKPRGKAPIRNGGVSQPERVRVEALCKLGLMPADTPRPAGPTPLPRPVHATRPPAVSVPVPSIGKDRREALRKLGLLKS